MSKTHSIQRARNFRMRRSSGSDQMHWAGLFIAAAVLLISIGVIYALDFVGMPFLGAAAMGSSGIVAFFLGYAIGVYGFSVRPMKLRYDYAFGFGIFLGIVFVFLNMFPPTAFGAIFYSLATAHSVLSSIIGLGVFGVLTLYIIFGFVSTKQTKV